MAVPSDYAVYWFGLNMYRILSPIMLIGGTIFNGLAFAVLFRKATKLPPTYFYLCSLSVVDMLALWIPCLRGCLYYTYGYDLKLNMGCSWYYLAFFGATNMSVYTIINMTIDRFIYVYFPFAARKICTMRRAIIGLVIIYILQILVNSHFPWTMSREIIISNVTNSTEMVVTVDRCINNPQYEYFMLSIWLWLDLIIYSFFPFLLLLVLNTLIIVKTVKQSRLMRKATGAQNKKDERKAAQQRKTTITLVAVSLMLLVTTNPVVALHLAESYWDRSAPYQHAVHLTVQAICEHLMYCNNSLNFVLYMFTGKRFREDLYVLFGLKTKVAPEVASVTDQTAVDNEKTE